MTVMRKGRLHLGGRLVRKILLAVDLLQNPLVQWPKGYTPVMCKDDKLCLFPHVYLVCHISGTLVSLAPIHWDHYQLQCTHSGWQDTISNQSKWLMVGNVFTELTHWAYSVIESRCPSVCVSVCMYVCPLSCTTV